MGFLDSLKSIFSGAGRQNEVEHWIYVRCRRCGEVIKTRVDLTTALNPHDEGGYLMHKTLVGNQLCFQRIEVTLFFDDTRHLSDQQIKYGDFVTIDDYEAKFDENEVNH